jgi:hypothetical protein
MQLLPLAPMPTQWPEPSHLTLDHIWSFQPALGSFVSCFSCFGSLFDYQSACVMFAAYSVVQSDLTIHKSQPMVPFPQVLSFS